MIVDVAAFVGDYPFRSLDDNDPDWLLRHMDRLDIDRAWVGHLPSFIYRDPAPGTAALVRRLEGYGDRLFPVPTIHPELPAWEDDLNFASVIGAPAIRVYPNWQAIDPTGGAMHVLVVAAAAIGIPVLFTVRFEDERQRHPLDTAPELQAAAIRTLVRLDGDVRFLVTNADRAFVEEVHFGLTPDEAARILWDFGWLWGPPEDHLRLLLETVGLERFTLGTGMPLRIPDTAVARLDLLDLSVDDRTRLTSGNLDRWRGD